MVKLFIRFQLLTIAISLTGCALEPTAAKLTTQNPAPIYNNNESANTRNNDNNTSEIDTAKASGNKSESTETVKPIVQTGRYTVIQAAPTPAQKNLLDVMITVTIPNDINTIDATIRYLLIRSGYHMPLMPSQDQEVIQILSKPLPEIHRKIGPMRLIDALTMLTTPAFEMVTDPVKREIRYQLNNNYKPRDKNISGVKS